MKPGSLSKTLREAKEAVAKWPQWQRDAGAAWLKDLREGMIDPCPCRARCDEAQTCQGRCRAPTTPSPKPLKMESATSEIPDDFDSTEFNRGVAFAVATQAQNDLDQQEIVTALKAENAKLRAALVMARDTLISSRVFVVSKQRVKAPEGEDLYDETIETVVGALATTGSYRLNA